MKAADESMQGKVCLITGATSGIGLATAKALATRGASVVLVGRDREKTAKSLAAVNAASGRDDASSLIADLSRQTDVRRLAEEFLQNWPRLDVLINNAGAVYADRRVSPDGLELTFALNHLAYFLLTNLLIDPLKAAAPSRIIIVSSEAHRWGGGLRFDDLQSEQNYGGFRAYGRSKLANILFMKELARRLEGSGVTVNAVHPGVVATNILGGNGWIGAVWRAFAWPFSISPEKGARTSIYLASSPDVAGITGQFFSHQKPRMLWPKANNRDDARRLWEISETLVGETATSPA